ncbi:hypothetical protein [Paenibacillus sp. 2TAB19]|uniref:hypothetical protein n=1 Tax=Paenibacillus sp. 2TAB19 TaxID=3233003 RepID=UPI003F96B95D
MLAMQMEFFDEAATSEEIAQAKSLLKRYRRYKDIAVELEKIATLSEKQSSAYNTCLRITQAVERAVRLIVDQEIRKAIQMRFIDGARRKEVVRFYRFMVASTVDRRINKGIESVANSIKMFEG